MEQSKAIGTLPIPELNPINNQFNNFIIMRNLVIMPAMANNRERMNLGEYAEEATIIMD